MTPGPAVGCCPEVTLSGGQAVRHPPVQVDRFVPSAACVYRVIPLGPVRDVPNVGELAMPTVTGPVALGIAGLAAMLVVGDPPVLTTSVRAGIASGLAGSARVDRPDI